MRFRCSIAKQTTKNRKVNRAESHGIKIIYSLFPAFQSYKRGKGMKNVEKDTLCVKDLYEGAYLLCMGFHLKKLTIIDANRKRKAVFQIAGDGIEEKAESYRMGQAMVNVAMLKFTLEKLKDAMFAKIRADQGPFK
jgi:hypothetical protein